MGWGDEIIASGQARVMQLTNPHKVVIYDRYGRIRSHEMWINNPRIAIDGRNIYKPNVLINGPGVRPYIAAKTADRWTWKEWDCPRGEIYFFPEEVTFASAYSPTVVIEPNNKAKASPNKDWGRERWQTLAALLSKAGLEVYQLGAAGSQRLAGVRLIETTDFRLACAVLARAKACVLPEGGLHHAAAALGVPSVVIFGGYISPRQTGYAMQTSLFTGGEPCGMRIPCEHCKQAMAKITPELVFEEVKKLLDG